MGNACEGETGGGLAYHAAVTARPIGRAVVCQHAFEQIRANCSNFELIMFTNNSLNLLLDYAMLSLDFVIKLKEINEKGSIKGRFVIFLYKH